LLDKITLPSVSATESLVLELLCDGERYGLELVESSGRRLKRGTVYVTLGRMERKGFVTSRQEAQPAGAIGLPRRLYTATAYGLKVLEAYQLLREALALRPSEAQG
jgi:PadR family transcriptional regulator, regulatory protein PadR